MDDFSAKPGEPNMFGLTGSETNSIAPQKRMLSSMTPTIIEKDIEEYGLLKITQKGKKFLKKPTSFKFVLNNVFADENAEDDDAEGPESAGATDEVLFEMLKDLRQKEAKKINTFAAAKYSGAGEAVVKK